MPGYSSTPLARKLGVKAGGRVLLVDAPPGWLIPDPPPGVSQMQVMPPVQPSRDRRPDVVVAFFREAAELERAVQPLGAAIFPDGMVWIAWPRRAGGHQSDITEDLIRSLALPLGLVDTKVAAIDEDWSGLRLVWRLERRGS